MTEVGFEWVPSYDERVVGYYLYRSNPTKNDGKLERIAVIDEKYASHYVDTNLLPETAYYYRMSTFSAAKQESEPSPTVNVMTQPLLKSVPFIQAIVGLPNRVKLIWRPHPFQRVASYIIERNELKTEKWTKIAEVKGRLNAEYIDGGLKDNHVYRYRVLVKTYDGIISRPSQMVEAQTKPLPKTIKNITASRDIPKKIVLHWDAATEKDVSYYKVYSAPTSILFYTYLAKTKETSFEDLINSNGTDRYYKVTAVDEDGLESLKQENPIMGTTLGVPLSPAVNQARHDSRQIFLSWSQTDGRAVKYEIIKTGAGKEEHIQGITQSQFTDMDVHPGREYTYKIIAIDQFGLASKPSEDVVITLPKE